MVTKDRGSAITILVEFKKNDPFGTAAYFDPAILPTIMVTDPLGAVKVNGQNMTKKDTGRYYYVCQTATTWETGVYTSKAEGGDGTYNDITTAKCFQLK